MLFGIPKYKDEYATESYNENGIIQKAVKYIKRKYPEFLIIGDVCCCKYTNHGHCGDFDEKGYVKNDETLEILAKIALSYAKAGVDIIAPSDMMDGRVEKISEILDKNGFGNIAIMSYSVKIFFIILWAFQKCCKFGTEIWRQKILPDGLQICRR